MKWYYLALLIWILKIILWVSILGIPIEIYISNNSEWFEKPFCEAEWKHLLGGKRQ